MLREYLRLFGDFTKTSLSVSRICRYLQRYWIPGNLGKTPSGIEVREIYPVRICNRCFVFDIIVSSLWLCGVNTVLIQLNTNWSLHCSIYLTKTEKETNKTRPWFVTWFNPTSSLVIWLTDIWNLIQFRIDKVGPNEGQQFYEKEFEAQYIERLKQFYSKESSAFLQANGVSLYLQKVLIPFLISKFCDTEILFIF